MTDKPTKADKAKKASADVDALLTEVTKTVKTVTAKQPVVAPAPAPAVPEAKAKPAAAAKASPAPKAAPKPVEKKPPIQVKQIKSGICTPKDHKHALKALGLRNINHVVTIEDTPSIRGQILKVRHLVEVKPA